VTVAEWSLFPFEQVLSEPVRNGIYKQKQFHGRGCKIVNMGELFGYPRMRSVPMKRVELNASELQRFALAEGDLIFARRSLTAEGAGKCSIVLELDDDTTFESSIIRVRPDPNKASSLFLYYFFNSPVGFHRLDTIRRQVAVAGITGTDLSKLAIPVPPIEEQRAIASILGTLDDKIELNRQMNETLEAMARAIFKDLFVDFGPTRAKIEGNAPYLAPELWSLFPDRLDDEDKPAGWQLSTLSAVSELNPESWSAQNKPDRVEYVDLANTKWGTIETTEAHSWDAAPSRARRVLRPGDTIVGTVRPGNGSYAFIDQEGLTGSTGFAVLRPRSAAYRELVYCAATSTENIERLSHLADGAAYPAVRPDVVTDTEIALGPPSVTDVFSATCGSLIDRCEANKRENKTLAATRDLLLPKLISGEVRVRDAEKMAEAAL